MGEISDPTTTSTFRMVEWQSRNQLSDFTWRITIRPLKAYMGESENSVYPHKSLFKREHDDNPKIFFHRYTIFRQFHTVDGRNSAPVDKWFYLIIYKVSTIQAGAGFLLSTVYMYEYINMYSVCENCSTSSWSRQTGPRQTGRQGTWRFHGRCGDPQLQRAIGSGSSPTSELHLGQEMVKYHL